MVAAGLADKCEIQVAYAIGVARPLSINVDTFGTGHAAEADIEAELSAGDLFDFRPAAIIRALELTRPKGWSYRDTSVNGHFGWNHFPWERTDKAEALRDAFGVKARRVA